MTTLYELSKTVQQVILEVIDAEGDITGELQERLEASGIDFKSKALNIGRWIMNIEAEEPGLKAEIERLQNRLKYRNNHKEKLEKYLMFCIENAGLDRVELDTFTLSVDKNPPSVAVDNEGDLPSKYIKIEQINTIDKIQLKKDLKVGPVSGAHLVVDKTHLKIR